jgi:hypothetical protein
VPSMRIPSPPVNLPVCACRPAGEGALSHPSEQAEAVIEPGPEAAPSITAPSHDARALGATARTITAASQRTPVPHN